MKLYLIILSDIYLLLLFKNNENGSIRYRTNNKLITTWYILFILHKFLSWPSMHLNYVTLKNWNAFPFNWLNLIIHQI